MSKLKVNSRREFFRRVSDPHAFDLRSINKLTGRRATQLTAEQTSSRFLAQATLGANKTLIDYVTSIGIEAWLDEQFNTPQSEILEAFYQIFPEQYIDGKDEQYPNREPFRYVMWDAMMMGDDLLRQRVALALSEIFVISTENDDIYNVGNGAASWYDMLLKNAFGNFRDLLFDVTISPIMGNYLSHAGNRKTDLSEGRFPDENYAREVMQLFTIGLFYLNDDGSLALDGNGEPIPTYDNNEITEFAKIFTGLTYDHTGQGLDWEVRFEDGWLNPYSAVRPMRLDDSEHEPGEKVLLYGVVIPAGGDTLSDLNAGLDNLFYHQNVGPFIGRQLIQRLVKSNPTPEYISRITAVFNNNGQGVRGDLQAVIRAILLDEEARDESYLAHPTAGKLREPFFRYVHLMRAFNYTNPQSKFWDAGWRLQDELRQYMFNAPSVFNFFSPDYVPPGPMGASGLKGPEFQLMNSYTAISTMNVIYMEFEWGSLMSLPDGEELYGQTYQVDPPTPDWTTELDLAANDIDGLIDHLDVLLTFGTLSAGMRDIIRTALTSMAAADWNNEPEDIVKLAIYLFLVSPDYAIQV